MLLRNKVMIATIGMQSGKSCFEPLVAVALTFPLHAWEGKWIDIERVIHFRCSSPVGYYNRANRISLASGCWYKGIVMHEIAHSLGFYHEQSRPDRDQYVTINWGNISSGMLSNYNAYFSAIRTRIHN